MDKIRQVEILEKVNPFIEKLAYLATGTYKRRDSWNVWFYTKLLPIKHPQKRLRQLQNYLDQADIRQELVCWTLEKLSVFQERDLRVESYIKKYLPYKLRDYLLTQIASIERELSFNYSPEETVTIDLSSLTPYEQYIIYLYYWENLTLENISDKLFRARGLISEDIKKSLNVLKENYSNAR